VGGRNRKGRGEELEKGLEEGEKLPVPGQKILPVALHL